MSKKVEKTKEKEKKKKYKEELRASVPDEVKIIFGKFYVFSFVMIVFLAIIFPFFLVNRFHKINLILILIALALFYLYMVIDVIRHKKNFNSGIFIILIVLVIISLSFSVVKLIV